MRFFFILICSIINTVVFSQEIIYSPANAHSHNDYEQKRPFYSAYENGFGSIEADIHLINGKLLVGHDVKDLDESRTLENLYLSPISKIKKIKKNIQLLVDVKTDAKTTLDRLIETLKSYPSITKNKNIKIVISGNRPQESAYMDYPDFIYFDGRLDKEYTAEQLKKIALLSDDYGRFTKWKKVWPALDSDRDKMITAIEKGHKMNKPVRLWGSPDFPEAWDEMKKLKIDFINTDKIEALADYLKK